MVSCIGHALHFNLYYSQCGPHENICSLECLCLLACLLVCLWCSRYARTATPTQVRQQYENFKFVLSASSGQTLDKLDNFLNFHLLFGANFCVSATLATRRQHRPASLLRASARPGQQPIMHSMCTFDAYNTFL